LSGRLVVCPTPIGNLEDITLRVLSALRSADVVACEDTRRTRVLLDRYGVSASLVSYHEHNERERSAELVRRMAAGETVALVSDAGMPLVSDPGFVLVQACVAAGLEVEVLPGPSAALAALVASGLPAETWRFVGFLPRKKGELAEVFAATP
jgi:16S rRNA (cytidine1402-2'-O)-methyltransferase